MLRDTWTILDGWAELGALAVQGGGMAQVTAPWGANKRRENSCCPEKWIMLEKTCTFLRPEASSWGWACISQCQMKSRKCESEGSDLQSLCHPGSGSQIKTKVLGTWLGWTIRQWGHTQSSLKTREEALEGLAPALVTTYCGTRDLHALQCWNCRSVVGVWVDPRSCQLWTSPEAQATCGANVWVPRSSNGQVWGHSSHLTLPTWCDYSSWIPSIDSRAISSLLVSIYHSASQSDETWIFPHSSLNGNTLFIFILFIYLVQKNKILL